MKQINFNKSVGKNHHIEINSLYTKNYYAFPFGIRLSIGSKGIYFNFALMLFEIDFDIKWNCDHAGFNISIDTPWLQLLDLEFYDIRHLKDKD